MAYSKNLWDDLKQSEKDDLLGAIQGHSQSATTYSGSELSEAQRGALAAYLKQEPDRKVNEDEVDVPATESRFVAGDVADAVDSVVPKLMGAVTSQPRFVEFESEHEGDVDEALMQSLAVESVLRDRQDEPHRFLHDWIKSGLLYRVGIARVQWFQSPMEPFELKNVTLAQFINVAQEAQMSDDIVLDTEPEITEGNNPEDYPPNGQSFTITGKKMPEPELVLENLPPESLLIPPYTETLSQRTTRGATYLGITQPMTLARLRDMFPDKRKEIDMLDTRKEDYDPNYGEPSLATSGDDVMEDERRYERFGDDQSGQFGDQYGRNEGGETSVPFFDEYVRYDLNKDGHAELVNVQRAGRIVLNVCEVRDNPLAFWVPFPIPNKAIGESLVDKVMDIQHVSTSLIRSALDATSMSVNPRVAIDASNIAIGDVETADTMDDLMAGGSGMIIRCLGKPSDTIETLTPDPTASQIALDVRNQFKTEREERVGLAPASRGQKGEAAINRTAAGMAMNMMPGAQFINHIAGHFASGLRMMALKVRDMLREGAKPPMRVRKGNEIVEVDPTRWASLDCKVNVVGAMLNHQEKLTFLSMMLAEQKEMLDRFGLENPMITLHHVRRTLVEMAAVLGFRDPNQFFSDMTDEQIMELAERLAQQNPEAEKLELERQKAQMQMEIEGMKMQAQAERDQFEAQMDAEKAAMDMQMQAEKLMFELQLKLAEMQAENVSEQQKTVIEAQMERIKADMDALLEERKQNREAALEIRKQNIESKLKEKEIEEKGKTERKIGAVRQGGKVG